MRLRWDSRALKDIEKIYAYIAADNPKAAKRVVEGIEESIGRLVDHANVRSTRRHKSDAAFSGSGCALYRCSSCSRRHGGHPGGAPYGSSSSQLSTFGSRRDKKIRSAI